MGKLRKLLPPQFYESQLSAPGDECGITAVFFEVHKEAMPHTTILSLVPQLRVPVYPLGSEAEPH
jgi:hypothetical protein